MKVTATDYLRIRDWLVVEEVFPTIDPTRIAVRCRTKDNKIAYLNIPVEALEVTSLKIELHEPNHMVPIDDDPAF